MIGSISCIYPLHVTNNILIMLLVTVNTQKKLRKITNGSITLEGNTLVTRSLGS